MSKNSQKNPKKQTPSATLYNSSWNCIATDSAHVRLGAFKSYYLFHHLQTVSRC